MFIDIPFPFCKYLVLDSIYKTLSAVKQPFDLNLKNSLNLYRSFFFLSSIYVKWTFWMHLVGCSKVVIHTYVHIFCRLA